MKGEGKFLNFI